MTRVDYVKGMIGHLVEFEQYMETNYPNMDELEAPDWDEQWQAFFDMNKENWNG